MTKEERAEMLALMREAMQPINNRLDAMDSRFDKLEQYVADVKQMQMNSVV